MSPDLYPTPTRLKLLRQVANRQVIVDLTLDDGGWRVVLFPYAPTQYQDQVTVTHRIDELERAGWVKLLEPAEVDYVLTDEGWQILATYGGPAT
jgi:hypothetical protein